MTTAAILSLGKAISATLDHDDLLSQWMAYYIAERITALETLTGESRAAAESEIADHILRLWEHRHGAALQRDPLAATVSVERAIARFDPKQRRQWGTAFDDGPTPDPKDVEADTYLRLALHLDRTTADLVFSLARCAAATAVDTEADWIRLVQASGLDPLRRLKALLEHGSVEAVNQSSIEAEKLRIVELAEKASALLQPLIDLVPNSSKSSSDCQASP